VTVDGTAGGDQGCRLYLISPPDLSAEKLTAFATTLDAALSAGDVACLQLRLKKPDETPVPDAEIRRAVVELLPITQKHDVAFILNDRPDLAAELGCDGVHVGQEDASYADARRLLGDDAIVGVTSHDSRHLALEAAEAGADYVAFGAFFDTGTKAPKSRAGRDILTWWSEITEVPCVAIGGITADNCAPLIAAGANFLAVSAGVWSHPDGPADAVRAFSTACA
jgi:thiamine-phosphate pyrophosphorylase